MAPKTRAQQEAEMLHVMRVVLDLPQKSTLENIVNHHGYFDIASLLTEKETKLDTLTYPEDDGKGNMRNIRLQSGTIGQLRLLRKFLHARSIKGEKITDWKTISREDYTDFQASPDITLVPDPLEINANSSTRQGNTGSNIPSTTVTNTGTTNTQSSLEKFERGIKRESSFSTNTLMAYSFCLTNRSS